MKTDLTKAIDRVDAKVDGVRTDLRDDRAEARAGRRSINDRLNGIETHLRAGGHDDRKAS